ncbi:MAG: response regulator [Alphaproteobacteria bacterium]|nr:response regulator [Alphaproteobacteria bacterium]
MTHTLLEWQLRKTAGKTKLQAEDAVCALISQAYADYERTLQRQQHALDTMSQELNTLNANLRKERDEKLAESERRFELAAEGASDGIWDWQALENRLWMSPRCQEMLGFQSESKTGTIEDWYALIVPEDRAKAQQFIDESLNSRHQVSATLGFLHADGVPRHVICRATVTRDSSGRPARLIGAHTDVSDFVRMNEQLKRAQEVAEAANIAKSDFLANMSHELRTPLNSIIGMTHLLMGSTLPAPQRELVESVHKSSANLLEIVNDILDLSKIEAGEVTLESLGFDLSYVLDSVLMTLEQLAREKGLSLVGRYNPSALPYIVGDPLRVSRILMNLISNAVKYTEKGSVEVFAQATPTADGSVEICCEVRDTGIGIPPEKQAQIFDKFVQADTSTTRRYGGTGLGLAITRELVELMGGTIGVESAMGSGSTFRFVIPFKTTTQISALRDRKKRKPQSHGNLQPAAARVLIAEDHPMNQILMTRLMEGFGISRFDIVENGRGAATQAKTGHWDLILMDCHMPEMSGYDATREIRAGELGTKRHIPIIAMTANAMTGEKEKCLRFGMDDYISKPIDIDELRDILGQWIAFPAAAPDSAFEQITAAAQEEGEEDAHNGPPVDFRHLQSFTDGDTEMTRELVEAFLTQSRKNIDVLQASMSPKANNDWREAAHMLKGGAGGIGARTLSALCEQAQNAVCDISVKSSLLFDICDEYTRVEKSLDEYGTQTRLP